MSLKIGQTRLPFTRRRHGSSERTKASRTTEFESTSKAVGRSQADAVTKEYIDVADSVSNLGDEQKVGELTKTSLSKMGNKVQGPPRKRRFRLTPEALQYFNQFSQGKVRRTFPLTSIEDIQYNEDDTPTSFRLVFHSFIMILEGQTAAETKEWVDALRQFWMAWNEDVEEKGEEEVAEKSGDDEGEEDAGLNMTPGPDSVFASARPPRTENPLELAILAQTSSQEEQSPFKTRPPGLRKGLRPHSTAATTSSFRIKRLHSMPSEEQIFQRRPRTRTLRQKLRLAPKLEKQVPINAGTEDEEAHKKLHHDFTMIKYPRSRWSIPSEQIVRLDRDNLHIFWRKNMGSRISHLSNLRLDSILEVRLGQHTDGFERFPYEEVEKQSFSLIYENIKGKYAVLESIDLICDHPDHFEDWIKGLESLHVGPLSAMFPSRYENTDPCLLWLKRIWTVKQDYRELAESDATKIAYRINPLLTSSEVKQLILEAHYYQHDATMSYSISLKWDGFVLFYNLMCGEVGRLYEVFSNYAKAYKRLGLTLEEFKLFLIEECNWKERDCGIQKLRELITFHDHHHRSFKKFASSNKPDRYKLTSILLSYAGFLSFIRSNQNAVVNPLHNTVYQDMSQPMSHYFINSSHNTYLETDQIKGRSTLDAYVRALLQGSRCVEIDCWDNSYGPEPIIYHGYTFTTKLQLRDVVKTIRDYAFRMSHYPLIISIENHCSAAQQARMAKIFREELENNVAQSMLATENLVEGEDVCRRRLPSPQELQGKIILKASIRHSASKLVKTKSTAAVKDNIDTVPKKELVKEPTKYEFEPTYHALARGSTRRQARIFQREVQRTEGNVTILEDDQELDYTETSEDLKSLIVYCRSTRIKPWSWREQKSTSICQMFSFSELSADQHCDRSPKEMLACTERQFVRTYPRGAKINSNNYDPIPYWNTGIQMAALNYQYPDIHMQLNQGRFRQNGGCGYVLKPAIMRRVDPGGGSLPFDPLMSEPHPLVPSCQLEIELLSGQNLSLGKKVNSIVVEIHTYGIANDTTKMNPRAEASNPFWPQWPSGVHVLSCRVLMPELCLVYFCVSTSSQLIGQNCICLSSLQPGLKFVQLRKATGELIPEMGLFVRIKTVYQDHATPVITSEQSATPIRPTPPKLVHQDNMDLSLRYDEPSPLPSLEIHDMEEQSEEMQFLNRHGSTLRYHENRDDGSMMNFFEMSENSSLTAPMNIPGWEENSSPTPMSSSKGGVNIHEVERITVTAEIENM